MPYAKRLHIYDADDFNITNGASVRSMREGDSTKQLGVKGGVAALVDGLDKLLKEKWTFTGVLFETHGNAGRIFFGEQDKDRNIYKQRIDRNILMKRFINRGYERLFPTPFSRMYFSGCNVAESEEGWYFLATAATIFLRTAGGVAFGHTSLGYTMSHHHLLLTSPLTYFIGAGKVVHFTGNKRYVYVGPGGNVVKREGE